MSQASPPVALVTGAARRIGRTIALTLARHGWDVAVHYHRSDTEAAAVVAEIQALGRRAAALGCDLADEAAVRALPARAAAALGPLQLVVNNAAIFDEDRVATLTRAALDLHMHTNLLAPLLLAHALHAATPEGAQSCVINLLDQKLCNLNPDFLSYTLSKAALQCATVTLAQELAPKVRVVGISPGISLVSGHQSEADFAVAHQATPLGRSSTPQDIADAVAYLAQARAVTGTTLVVDGGQHLIPLPRDVMYVATAATPSP